jgi:N-acetyl sugar amidotransferase
MDTSAAEIQFDASGTCSFCREFDLRAGKVLSLDREVRQRKLEALVADVRSRGRGRPYDCVVGVSGGVDSSWVLVNAVRMGLRPLAVHMDNGWNSELAQNNVANLVRGLGVDLYTHVIDWTEYRGLMQAFFDADVIDVELLYDNAMLAVNCRQAMRIGTRHILSGMNSATEGIRMPAEWSWCKFDKRNIKALGAAEGIRLRTFPAIGTLGHVWYTVVRRLRWEWFLDFIDFNKLAALEELQSSFGYKPYPYKHYESVFTRFYQGYILPEKFGVDKRRVHFSSLIVSGQMTREQALEGLRGIPYSSEDALEADKAYFVKKMGWNRVQLDEYIRRPPRSHAAYASESGLFEACVRARKWLTGSAGRRG